MACTEPGVIVRRRIFWRDVDTNECGSFKKVYLSDIAALQAQMKFNRLKDRRIYFAKRVTGRERG